ncbi:MAG: glycoside hydrolase family 18 protein [Chitinophagaceae bacterium]|nr:glycoside hydrolase family 18 protein [Chitinophagaceae bacterium]
MKNINALITTIFCITLLCFQDASAQTPNSFRIVGYYSGRSIPIDSFETQKLTHLIFCFGGLKGNRLLIHTAKDSDIIKSMVKLKAKHPTLKVMLSLGGWGGCQNCSDVFHTEKGRKEFAASVKEISNYFKTDGLDLDWEYPVVSGFPGHTRRPEDKDNFTALLKEIRRVNKAPFEISFAAGGYTAYIDSAIDWKNILPYTNFINIMSYDLVHGFSKTSGHHTPLYSTPQQIESTDHAVQMLLKAGVPANKLVIGAAFYGRFFKIDDGHTTGLYQACHFSHGFSHKNMYDSLSEKNGFIRYWDDIAQAPYAINESRKLLATYDDDQSVRLKTQYALQQKLGGIMFWQLYDDSFQDGLLNAIYQGTRRP